MINQSTPLFNEKNGHIMPKNFKQIMVHGYKYNGWLYRVVEFPYVLFENKTLVCLYLPVKNVHVIKSKEDSFKAYHSQNLQSKFWFFFKEHWFNLIVNLHDNEYGIYVNIAAPYLIEEQALKYIDFDIDFRIKFNNTYSMLDNQEYITNAKKWLYNKKIKEKVENAKLQITTLIKKGWFQKLLSQKQIYYMMECAKLIEQEAIFQHPKILKKENSRKNYKKENINKKINKKSWTL